MLQLIGSSSSIVGGTDRAIPGETDALGPDSVEAEGLLRETRDVLHQLCYHVVQQVALAARYAGTVVAGHDTAQCMFILVLLSSSKTVLSHPSVIYK